MTDDETDTDGEQETDSTAQEQLREQVNRLESLIEQQQATIKQLQANQDTDSDDSAQNTDGETVAASDYGWMSGATRRAVLTSAGILGLLGMGAGTASADASGQIGTSNDPLQDLYTETLHGHSGNLTLTDNLGLDGNRLTNVSSFNGGFTSEEITDIEGSGLSVISGTLNASGASAWSDGDAADLLEPSDGTKAGIEVDKLADNGDGSISMQSTLDLASNDLEDSGTTLWNSTAGNIPGARIEASGITNGKLATDAVGSNELKSGAVGTSELASDVVTSVELDSGNIADLSQVVGSSVTAGANLDMGSNSIQNTGAVNTGTVSDTGSGLSVTTNNNGNITLDPGSSNTVDATGDMAVSGTLDLSSANKMTLPQVTTDPSASAGDMWYRSDLD
jgi:hypothetical protein